MLEFIDKIVIPFLTSLYAALGYGGVLVAMAIESAMIPLPSELILPFAGFLVSDPTQLEPLTGGPWNFWIVVIVATVGNTIGSPISFPAGVARMNVFKFVVYSTAGAFIWSIILVQLGVVFGQRWTEIRHLLQPFDLGIAVLV